MRKKKTVFETQNIADRHYESTSINPINGFMLYTISAYSFVIWWYKFGIEYIANLPDWDSLCSSSSRSTSFRSYSFGQCLPLLLYFSFLLQNFVGSKIFSTEKANFLHVALSLLVSDVEDVIDRVKSTGHTCGRILVEKNIILVFTWIQIYCIYSYWLKLINRLYWFN